MTPKEITDLRLGCINAIAETCSKVGLTSGEMLSIAKQVYAFVVEPLSELPEGKAKVAPKGK